MNFLSFFRRSVNENELSVKGKARCGATLDGKNGRRLIPKGIHVSVSLGFVERQKQKELCRMKTAVIYARYSSENQTEQSIEGQLRVCEEYAKAHDILILNTYVDRAMTGTNDNRADFQRMLKDSSKREWNFVLVYKLDRFSRNKYETAIHKKTLKDHGIKVLSATEHIPDSPEGIIFESMLEGYAEYYSAELSQKVKRGMNETRLKGNYTGGHLLYGYKKEGKKLVIDEQQAEVVRFIFEQYSIGVYVKHILLELDRRGVTYHDKEFGRSTVYNILKNEKYAGIYRFRGELIENMFPQIVPTEIFEKVREKVEKNHYGKRSVQVIYLLRNKLKCGYCGQSVNAECGTSQNGKKKYYYKCLGRKHNSGCKKSVIRKEILEKLVLDRIIRELNRSQIMQSIVANLMYIQEEQTKESSALNMIKREKRQVDTALNNLVAAIEQGIFSNTTNKRPHELESKQEELEKQMLIEKRKLSVQLSEETIRRFYTEALKSEPQLLIECLVKEIILFDDKIEIQFNSPIKISPDESRGFTFYTEDIRLSYKDPHRADAIRIEVQFEMKI